MRIFVPLLLFFTVLFAGVPGARGETLMTRSFVIVIIHNDPEGTVTSDNITYVGVSRKTGNTIRLKGSTVHLHDAEGTPSKFIGYRFVNDRVTYRIYDNGSLEITSGKKVLLKEKGQWVFDE